MSNRTQSLLDELYAERGEILDNQYARTRQLMGGKGYWTDDDIADLKAKERDITDQIHVVETLEWMSEVEASAADENDLLATQASAVGTLF